MTYHEITDTENQIDYLRSVNEQAMHRLVELQEQINELENTCYFYKSVDKRHRDKFGAV